jgi:hypothetical protein
MLLGIDHLVLAVADPDVSMIALAGFLGLPAGSGGRHPAWGTFNRLLWLGDTYLELLGVEDAMLAAGSWLGKAALRHGRDGDGLVGLAIASDDLDADVAVARERGADLGDVLRGERRRADGRTVRWRLALPPQLEPTSPFLIEHDPESAEWTHADRATRQRQPGRLVALDLAVRDVDAASRRLEASTGARFSAEPTSTRATPILRAELGPHVIRLPPATGGAHAPVEIHLSIKGRRPARDTLLGCTWVVS